MRKPAAFILAAFFFAAVSGCSVVAHREEIGTLRALGKDQDEQKEVLDQDTKNFERLKKALLASKLHAGMSAAEVRKVAGEPIVRHGGSAESPAQWSYKRGDGDWFKDEVIHLYFDPEGRLLRWNCTRFECGGV